MSDSVRPHRRQPTRFPRPWDSPGKNTRVGNHSLRQGIFPKQGLNPGFLHCRQILYHLSYQGGLPHFLGSLEIWTPHPFHSVSAFSPTRHAIHQERDESLVLKTDNPLEIKKVIVYINNNEKNDIFTIFDFGYEKDYAEEKFYFQTKEYKKFLKIIK